MSGTCFPLRLWSIMKKSIRWSARSQCKIAGNQVFKWCHLSLWHVTDTGDSNALYLRWDICVTPRKMIFEPVHTSRAWSFALLGQSRHKTRQHATTTTGYTMIIWQLRLQLSVSVLQQQQLALTVLTVLLQQPAQVDSTLVHQYFWMRDQWLAALRVALSTE